MENEKPDKSVVRTCPKCGSDKLTSLIVDDGRSRRSKTEAYICECGMGFTTSEAATPGGTGSWDSAIG